MNERLGQDEGEFPCHPKMPLHIPLSVIPEWFYQESKHWEGTFIQFQKEKVKTWIPDKRSRE